MAIYTALSGKTEASGFIAIASFHNDPASLQRMMKDAQHRRGYFITGEKDRSLDNVREVQKVLKENHIQFSEEVHPDLGHEFPQDFEKSFERATDFVFKESE